MRLPARRSDDDDLIRARLRALLAQTRQGGWVPPDDDLGGPSGARTDIEDDEDDEEEDVSDVGYGSDGPAEVGPVDGAAGRDGPERPRGSRLPAGIGRHRAPGTVTRLDPGRPGSWALWVVGLLAAVTVVGWTWVDRPTAEQVPAAVTTAPVTTAPVTTAPVTADPGIADTTGPPAPSSDGGAVVVSVVGQVVSPGLVTLPAGSRVADALAAAGGLLPDADPTVVNAAALLTDGQQIAVGVPAAAAPTTGSGGAAAPGGLLDLNSATVADLDALPGIGPVLAQRIVDHRTVQGRFTSIEQLDDVSGIGPAIYADLAQRVRV
ncbi:MAG: Competence protein ComEA-like protein with helix-hairpin-helix repeat region [Modestobacter sp.]|nr:Competence protein ComEA-like protein with helix-hairpin-helix repeat region [Modestobacter sp.]